jgi:hypothetical protein
MGIHIEVLDGDELIEADLQGGPDDIRLPVQRVVVDHDKVKVPWCGGYEHFERDESGNPRTFRWTTRTAIAE